MAFISPLIDYIFLFSVWHDLLTDKANPTAIELLKRTLVIKLLTEIYRARKEVTIYFERGSLMNAIKAIVLSIDEGMITVEDFLTIFRELHKNKIKLLENMRDGLVEATNKTIEVYEQAYERLHVLAQQYWMNRLEPTDDEKLRELMNIFLDMLPKIIENHPSLMRVVGSKEKEI